MRTTSCLASLILFGLLAANAQANGAGHGQCKTGFSDETMVDTQPRGQITIGEVQVSDRVWSFSEADGKPGWSEVLRRVDTGPHYTLFVDFIEPDTGSITKGCWRIKRVG